MKSVLALAVALAMSFWSVGRAETSIEKGSQIVRLDLGYGVVTPEATGTNENGTGIGIGYEQMTWKDVSLAAMFGMIGFTSDTSSGTANYRVNPLMVAVKFYFGGEKFDGYVGGAAGVHFSSVKTNGVTEDTSSLALAVPVGVDWWLSERTALNAGFTLNWTNESYLENDMSYLFMFGLAWRWGPPPEIY